MARNSFLMAAVKGIALPLLTLLLAIQGMILPAALLVLLWGYKIVETDATDEDDIKRGIAEIEKFLSK